jgi:heme-degrading monooxygenase HmoA
VKPGRESPFETALEKASGVISRSHRYPGHELQRCIEHPNRYILLARWDTIEDHTVGFRQWLEYQQWKSLLHHFSDPFQRLNITSRYLQAARRHRQNVCPLSLMRNWKG